MAITVEPKRVLQLINSMGYKNVSATELKEFTKGKFCGLNRFDAYLMICFGFRCEKID